jgi:DNA-binding beta-propeller fold protein YncE
MPRIAIGITSLAFVALAAASVAAQQSTPRELKQIASIPIPGEPLKSFDISFVDKDAHRYYLGDRSNAGVDMIDTENNKYLGRIGGFVGAIVENGKVVSNKSGPNGVLAIGDQLWAGDGDSTVKVIDLKQGKITDVINTGGKKRADEMAYDSNDHILAVVNNADEPPFATLISTEPDHKILAKIPIPEATDGFEQPDYNLADGMFYVSIPELNKEPTKGGVAVIDPRAGKLVNILPVENCQPRGLVFGPDQEFVVGCAARGKDNMPPITVVMDARKGALIAKVAEIGGADMVAYSAKNNQYYSGSGNQPGGGVLGVIDAKTHALVQKIQMKGPSTPHSVAVDDSTGHIYVPGGGGDGGCSCIQVLGLQ